MDKEKQLITKTYYKSLIPEDETRHPVEVLGDLFLEEQKKEIPDSSLIRYCQGEVYFLNKDYEAAIFKWENVHNELEPWAKKNIADAYLEMKLYTTAEEIYQSVETDSLVLRTEVLLQLFSLYLERKNDTRANEVIKQIVELNPDYPDVTKIARAFFEKREDWDSAFELALREGLRTEDTAWFETLKSYVKNGYAKQKEPQYFFPVLTSLQKDHLPLFEQFITALWENYKDGPQFFEWLKEINQYLKDSALNTDYQWQSLPHFYKQAYEQLMAGDFSMQELSEIIPDLLHVWAKIAGKTEAVYPAAAIFAWNDTVPNRFNDDALKIAERALFHSKITVNVLKGSKELFQSLVKWIEKHDLDRHVRLEWMGGQLLDFENQIVGVTALHGGAKATFISHFLNEDDRMMNQPQSFTCYKNGEHYQVKQLNDYEEKVLSDEQLHLLAGRQDAKGMFFEVQLPKPVFTHKLMVMDLPVLNIVPSLNDRFTDVLHCLDSLLFVVDGEHGLSEVEESWIELIRHEFPGINIYFVINKQNNNEDSAQFNHLLRETDGKLIEYGFTYEDRDKTARILRTDWQTKGSNMKRILKYLYIIKRIMDQLLEQRVKVEKQLEEFISRKEDLAQRINGAIHQLEDMEQEKAGMIQKSFHLIKEETEKEMVKQIPVILKRMSKYVTKSRNFQKLHIELNDEMNNKIRQYLDEEVLPQFLNRIQEWLKLAEEQLQDGKRFLDEINEGFNGMIGKDRLQLTCDFKVLEDWQRDIDRLTSNIHFQPINIFTRNTPVQVLLKGAGKVLRRFTKNKDMLVARYKQFIENESYEEVAKETANQFLKPFTLLEHGIERDVNLFFRSAFMDLRSLADEINMVVLEKREKLDEIRDHPESFRDPLKIFEITRLQYKYIIEVEEMSGETAVL